MCHATVDIAVGSSAPITLLFIIFSLENKTSSLPASARETGDVSEGARGARPTREKFGPHLCLLDKNHRSQKWLENEVAHSPSRVNSHGSLCYCSKSTALNSDLSRELLYTRRQERRFSFSPASSAANSSLPDLWASPNLVTGEVQKR